MHAPLQESALRRAHSIAVVSLGLVAALYASTASAGLSPAEGSPDADFGTLGVPPPPPARHQCGTELPAHLLYLNFDGPQMIMGSFDDPKTNATPNSGFVTKFDPFGDPPGGSTRTALMAAVREHFAPFNVEVTDVRPPADRDYGMVVVSGTGRGGSRLGWANRQCGGNLNGVAFAHYSASQAASELAKAAQTIVHETGHMMGLDHTSDRADIMYPTASSDSEITFLDRCVAHYANELSCIDIHGSHCGGDTTQQNSFAELFAVIGATSVTGDCTLPLLEIVSPAHGDHFEVGADVTVDVSASDDVAVVSVEFFIDGTSLGTRYDPPYVATFPGLTEGVHTLKAEATDSNDNRADHSIQIAVGDAEVVDEPEGPTTGNPTAGNTETDGTTAGADGGGCRSAAAPSWALLSGLVFVRRRRRR